MENHPSEISVGTAPANKLSKAITLMVSAIVISLILMFMSFVRRLGNFPVTTLLLIPWICIVVSYPFRKVLQVEINLFSPYPSLLSPVIIAVIALFAFDMKTMTILDYHNIWLPTCIIAAVLATLLLLMTRPFGGTILFKRRSIAFFIVVLFGYSFLSTEYLNFLIDKTAPVHYSAIVLRKRIVHSRRNNYCSITLAPWGPQKYKSEITVTPYFYDEIHENDYLSIYFRQGGLNIPWYRVEGKEK
ncbi:hypothetical protein ACE38W_15960 [Chitinophaga sp. Hz27]|uniref:hypothetical protein n=1 Tax=Chitinophaga sp. Hz27 TaxID=3347169 RepID=UPI0035D8FC2B